MKNLSLLSLVITIIIGGCNRPKSVETTVIGMGTNYYLLPFTLNGKVREFKELNYWAVGKEGQITKGNLMTKKDLDSIGSTPNFIVSFDINGILTLNNLLDGETITNTTFATVENGKWTKFDAKIKDSLVHYFIPKYDNSGYFTGGSDYRAKADTLLGKFEITNDINGRPVKFDYYNYKSEKTNSDVCSYDEKGNIIETKSFNKADSLVSTMTNLYNEKGSMVKQQVVYEKPKRTEIWDYKDLKTDDHGNIIEYYTDVDNGKYKIFSVRSIAYY